MSKEDAETLDSHHFRERRGRGMNKEDEKETLDSFSTLERGKTRE